MSEWKDLPPDVQEQVALTAHYYHLLVNDDPNGTPGEFSLVWLALKCFDAGKKVQSLEQFKGSTY